MTRYSTADALDVDRTLDAAAELDELARYLAHATLPAAATLPLASDSCALLGSLQAALRATTQVLAQTAQRLADLAADPTLAVDALGAPEPAATLASRADRAVRGAAGCLREADRLLDDAVTAASRLRHSEER